MSFDPALITLVARDNILDQGIIDTDYQFGADEMKVHEEVRLASPNGEPSAIPTSLGVRDLDYQHNYVNGSTGRTRRLKTYNPSFNIDYISADVRQVLQRWKHANTPVVLNPNFGRSTEASYYAIPLSGSTYRGSGLSAFDSTELYGVTAFEDANTLHWDYWQKIFRGKMPANVSCIVPTPAGAGLLTSAAVQNRAIPSYPESAALSAGPGKSGWGTGGVDAGDITFTHNTNGFGHSDCPHSLRVQTNNNPSTDRYLTCRDGWNPAHANYQGYSFTGSGYRPLTIWFKGRFPRNAYVRIEHRGDVASSNYFYFDGEDFSEWRPVTLMCSVADWSLSYPAIYLALQGSYADPADFEIGPMFFNGTAATYHGREPLWRDHSDGLSGESRVRVTSVEAPKAGCYTASCYLPAGANNSRQSFGLFNSGTVSCLISINDSGVWTVRITTPARWYEATKTMAMYEGVLCVSFQYGSGRRALYLNGEKIGAWEGDEDQDMPSSSTGDLYIGYDGYDTLPAALLTVRVDRENFSDEGIKYMHSALRDPGALAVSVPARGRTFEIVEIPETPRPSPAGTQYVGRLKLRQIGYNHDLADITTKETVDF